MKLTTTLLLLVVLALLGGAIWWQKDSETKQRAIEVRLFGDVQVALVNKIRIDNIERGYNLKLERDSQGIWYITDPLEYAANRALVTALLEDIATANALVIEQNEWSASELGLDPPKVVVEVEEQRSDGPRVHALEVGASDIDRVRLNVRRDGRFMHGLVRVYTTLNHSLQDFRSRRAMTLSGDEVIEVHRSGKVQHELNGDEQDLELHAFVDGNSWRATSPQQALLAALDLGIVIYGAAQLEVSAFIEDEVRDASIYGFDVPKARIDLKAADGRVETLLLARPAFEKGWYVMRKDSPYVGSIDQEQALRLMYPSEAMVDLRFMRALRQDISSLRLVSKDGVELRLERGLEGWTVARRLGDGGHTTPLSADARRVNDELGRLEGLELRHPDVELLATSAHPSQAKLPAAIYLEIDGETLGGRIGFAGELATGLGLAPNDVLFQRVGDELLLVGEPWLMDLAGIGMSEFLSKDLLHLAENETKTLILKHEDQTLRFERDRYGIWHRAGEEAEAKDLLALLDPLIYLKAESFLEGEQVLEDPIDVVFERFEKESVFFRVGAGASSDAGPTSVADVGAAFSLLRTTDLHQRLLALF